jgi:hypothetical protein
MLDEILKKLSDDKNLDKIECGKLVLDKLSLWRLVLALKNNQTVRSLSFAESKTLNIEALELILHALKQRKQTLLELNLNGVLLNDDKVAKLLETFLQKPSSLRLLSLVGCKISDKTLQMLTRILAESKFTPGLKVEVSEEEVSSGIFVEFKVISLIQDLQRENNKDAITWLEKNKYSEIGVEIITKINESLRSDPKYHTLLKYFKDILYAAPLDLVGPTHTKLLHIFDRYPVKNYEPQSEILPPVTLLLFLGLTEREKCTINFNINSIIAAIGYDRVINQVLPELIKSIDVRDETQINARFPKQLLVQLFDSISFQVSIPKKTDLINLLCEKYFSLADISFVFNRFPLILNLAVALYPEKKAILEKIFLQINKYYDQRFSWLNSQVFRNFIVEPVQEKTEEQYIKILQETNSNDIKANEILVNVIISGEINPADRKKICNVLRQEFLRSPASINREVSTKILEHFASSIVDVDFILRNSIQELKCIDHNFTGFIRVMKILFHSEEVSLSKKKIICDQFINTFEELDELEQLRKIGFNFTHIKELVLNFLASLTVLDSEKNTRFLLKSGIEALKSGLGESILIKLGNSNPALQKNICEQLLSELRKEEVHEQQIFRGLKHFATSRNITQDSMNFLIKIFNAENSLELSVILVKVSMSDIENPLIGHRPMKSKNLISSMIARISGERNCNEQKAMLKCMKILIDIPIANENANKACNF